MVSPYSLKLHPFFYFTREQYNRHEPKLQEFARKKEVEINFDFSGQYFEIKGRSQTNVDNAANQISRGLLRVLNDKIDDNFLLGTFETIQQIRAANEHVDLLLDQTIDNPPMTQASSVADMKLATGRPIEFEDTEEVTEQVGALDLDDYLSGDSDPELYEETFTFSKNIANPKDVLKAPPQPNHQFVSYLKLVGDDTETECELVGRDIRITGYTQPSVQDALQRFRNIQTLYKRRRRQTLVVPCVHYPTEAPYYHLYFCDLSRYAHKGFVDLLYADALRQYYVLLPVFKNPRTGQFQKPKDLMDMVPARSNQGPPPLAQSYAQPQMAMMPPSRPPTARPPPSFSGGGPPAMPMAKTEALWGEDRGFVNNYAGAGPMPGPTSPRTPQESEDFPLLPSKPYPKPTVAHQKPTTRRVLRLNMQKSGEPHSDPAAAPRLPSLLEQAKDYNLFNMQAGLTEALEGLRGFRGEVRLSAKLGKVLWTDLTTDIQKKTWEFRDIKDVVVKEHGVRPVFNNVTTASDNIITRISEILPKVYSRSACFEIHAKARNQPAVDYKPVVMIMNQGVVEIKKVITRNEKVAEIDWVSLDRKFDFQMSLTSQELGRPDVKPYTTFVRKVSVCPITSQLTYENVQNFLEVDHILYKQKTTYRIHFPFLVEITRVERVPLKPLPSNGHGTSKVMGMTGRGKVWFDFQVYYTVHDEVFKSNLNLGVGKLAPWTVEDILGEKDQPTNLIDYVKCLLLIVEKCEPLFQQ